MAQGRYDQPPRRRRRRRNHLNLILWIVTLILFIALIIMSTMLLRRCDADSAPETVPETSSTGEPFQLPPMSFAEPTEAETQETTEETTEATEETTEPTEQTTEPTEETTEETTEPPETDPPAPSEMGDVIADFAVAQIGKPYELGGVGPDTFDSTGFIYYCFQENGISAPRQLSGQSTYGVEVSKENLEPGDVVFFWTENPGEVEYVAIYIGGGKIVAARNEKYPVSEMAFNSEYFTERFLFGRRFG